MLWRIGYTVVVSLLTLAASRAYERAFPVPPSTWERLNPKPQLCHFEDAGADELHICGWQRCAPSPWQRITIVQGGESHSIYMSCAEKRDVVLTWPTPADGGVPL